MLGSLRLVLAAMVVLSHSGLNPLPHLIGPIAVAVFFVISGFAMTGLISKRFATNGGTTAFLLERLVRLAPQYYLWLSLAVLESFLLGWNKLNTEGFIPFGLFSYLTVIPLGLQGYFGTLQTWVMPQASTLGVEITFYLIAPWIINNRRWSMFIGMTALIIYIASDLGYLTPAMYTYYTTPGPLPLFLIGSFLYRKDWMCLSTLIVGMVAVLSFSAGQPWNLETLIGLVIGLPVVATLSRLKPRTWDTALGNASYGCYLGQGVVSIALFRFLNWPVADATSHSYQAMLVVSACLAGYLSYLLVESPTVAFRRRLKAGQSAAGINPGERNSQVVAAS